MKGLGRGSANAILDVFSRTSGDQATLATNQRDRALARVDRDLFRMHVAGVPSGGHLLNVATFEPTGGRSTHREMVTAP